jgi:hypothetical protein
MLSIAVTISITKENKDIFFIKNIS